ncbi:hypothetical protein BC828DRAFT_371696 [Blastocladiella britannica]|nr:hypothetical protein BC828DRAFT_371696 [Blastocladiella britannica]
MSSSSSTAAKRASNHRLFGPGADPCPSSLSPAIEEPKSVETSPAIQEEIARLLLEGLEDDTRRLKSLYRKLLTAPATPRRSATIAALRPKWKQTLLGLRGRLAVISGPMTKAPRGSAAAPYVSSAQNVSPTHALLIPPLLDAAREEELDDEMDVDVVRVVTPPLVVTEQMTLCTSPEPVTEEEESEALPVAKTAAKPASMMLPSDSAADLLAPPPPTSGSIASTQSFLFGSAQSAVGLHGSGRMKSYEVPMRANSEPARTMPSGAAMSPMCFLAAAADMHSQAMQPHALEHGGRGQLHSPTPSLDSRASSSLSMSVTMKPSSFPNEQPSKSRGAVRARSAPLPDHDDDEVVGTAPPDVPLVAATQTPSGRVRWTVSELAFLEWCVGQHGSEWTFIHQLYGPNGSAGRQLGRFEGPSMLSHKASNEVRARRRRGIPTPELGPLGRVVGKTVGRTRPVARAAIAPDVVAAAVAKRERGEMDQLDGSVGVAAVAGADAYAQSVVERVLGRLASSSSSLNGRGGNHSSGGDDDSLAGAGRGGKRVRVDA